MKALFPLALAAVCLATSPLLHAKKDGGHGNPHHEENDRGGKPGKAGKKGGQEGSQLPEASGPGISIGITLGGARDLVRGAGIAPGSYQPLPPGMRNRLAKGKPLPPGIAKKQPPAAMLSRLPAHPGHEWLVIGVDLALVNIKTRIPVDILPGVF